MVILNILAMISAIAISAVAAYYSIAGLTAIFSGAFWPIVIMGSALEVGKIVTTVWVHSNWRNINAFLKYYMSIAVVVLMFITSMGIFGFLSRAHIETATTQGDNTLLIKQLDQNLAIEQQRVADNQNIIKQMDDAVNTLLKGSAANAERDNNRTQNMASQATRLRAQQKPERDAANKMIDETNKRIQELNTQKLKLEQERLKVEAEVGPVKYIAQLIYGDNIDKNLLERAVRWVIIFIVIAFDPLAVALVLGVTMSLNQRREETKKNTVIVEREVEKIVKVPVEKVVTVYNNEALERAQKLEAEVEELRKREPEVVYKEVIQPVPIYRDVVVEKLVEVPSVTEIERVVKTQETSTIELPVERIVEKIVEIEKPVDVIKEVIKEVIVEVPVEKIVEIQDTQVIGELTEAMDKLLLEIKTKDEKIRKLEVANEIYEKQDFGFAEKDFDFNVNNDIVGGVLPQNSVVGKLFIIHSQPDNLYKYNGNSWILVDKTSNTSYTQNKNWQNWQLGRLQRAEIEWDDMTVAEQEALETQFGSNG